MSNQITRAPLTPDKQQRLDLTEQRLGTIQMQNKLFPGVRQEFKKLEAQYGQYLYIPLDVSPVVPDDLAKFKDWYFLHAKAVKKIRKDIAGGTSERPIFSSIDSTNALNTIWETNKRDDLFQVFPELKDKIMQLPFLKMPEFHIWSSHQLILPHRDQGPWNDFPCSFRSLLLNENPAPTLVLQDRPSLPVFERPTGIKLPDDSTSFVWNNIRTMHSSTFKPALRKILMIFNFPLLDFRKLNGLYERSIQKYENLCLKSKYTITDYVNADIDSK